MKTFRLTVQFRKDRGYVGDPYWDEQQQLIDILKESGANRARSAATRRRALEQHLRGINMTLAEFEELERLAKRQFHKDAQGRIYIPRSRVEAFMFNVCDEIPAAQRPMPASQVRGRIICTDWKTRKTKADLVWKRPVTPKSGPGQKLSNQRSRRKNEVIHDFDATGEITVDTTFVKPDVLKNALQWGGQNVGIGASRKMGYGLFELTRWEEK